MHKNERGDIASCKNQRITLKRRSLWLSESTEIGREIHYRQIKNLQWQLALIVTFNLEQTMIFHSHGRKRKRTSAASTFITHVSHIKITKRVTDEDCQYQLKCKGL